MIVGMDFGTTNSGMAYFDGQELRLLPLEESAENPRVLRTALYITNEQEVMIGREAIDRYFAQNMGRPVRLQRVWVGEIEVIAEGVYYVQDIYVWSDVLSPGRLFLSFKTNLRDHEYVGTVIGQNFFPIESMVALYMTVVKRRAERILGRELREVVLGRPVHFAFDPEHDRLAQERLLRGAFDAGYERVYLEREPIAAAYDYASRAEGRQNILVFDFGGGTLDITVMRIDGSQREVLATGGVPIAGDVFDQRLVRAKLPRHFGEGSTYGPRKMPSPLWIYDLFSNWQTILELQSPQNMQLLREIEQGSSRPAEIRGLISLVAGNHGLRMFDAVEQTKRDLSQRYGSMIRLKGPEFSVLELVTRQEFEHIIRGEVFAIEKELDETMSASGLKAEELDAVIRTGGSAQIPIFQQMLQRKFGAEKLQALDTFSSVTAGLGIIAHGIASGEIERRAYTRDDLTRPPADRPKHARPGVMPVNLSILQRRIAAQELQESPADEKVAALVLLTANNELLLTTLPGELLDGRQPVPLAERLNCPAGLPPLLDMLVAEPEEKLLLVTSHYRFLLMTARQLLEGEALGLTVAELYHFRQNEQIFAIARWDRLRQARRLIIATSLGYVRSFPANVMVSSIESPVPWSFDNPLPGWPRAIMDARDGDCVVMVTDAGRALRVSTDDIPTRGVQALNRVDDETVVGYCLARADEELLLVTAGGYARRLPVDAVPLLTKPNSKGPVLITRKPVSGAARVKPGHPLWVATAQELTPFDPENVPLERESTRSYRLRELGRGAEALFLFSPE